MVDTGDLRSEKTGSYPGDMRRRGRRKSAGRRISGKVILVISGPGRSMLPNLTEPEGAIIPGDVAASITSGRPRVAGKLKTRAVPMAEWLVLQQDRLPAYITWERYLGQPAAVAPERPADAVLSGCPAAAGRC